MNNKFLVRLSNIIGSISILLLIYWVFIFISINVFELKVFRENITETFYMSVLGILALMFGALIINVMFNLTRIAEKHNQDAIVVKSGSKKIGLIFILSFPLIFGLLYGGDYLSSKKKQRVLIQAAKSIIESNAAKVDSLLQYSFSKKWIKQTDTILDLFSKTDQNFPNIHVLVRDSIGSGSVFLTFDDYYNSYDTTDPNRMNYLLPTTQAERDYLNDVFTNGNKNVRFSANDGRYELFYPYNKGKKTIILYFSDYQRYGKIGS